MERKEIVTNIKTALNEVSNAVVSAMNALHAHMNEQITVIAKAKRELAEDNDTLVGISVAVNDFVEDIAEVAVDMENVTSTVGNVIDSLDKIPDQILIKDEDDEDDEDDFVEIAE